MTKFLPFALLLAIAACGGDAGLGEQCDKVGNKDECVDGAVCTNDPNKHLVCRAICTEDGDCPDGYTCDSVSGTGLDSCQPR